MTSLPLCVKRRLTGPAVQELKSADTKKYVHLNNMVLNFKNISKFMNFKRPGTEVSIYDMDCGVVFL